MVVKDIWQIPCLNKSFNQIQGAWIVKSFAQNLDESGQTLREMLSSCNVAVPSRLTLCVGWWGRAACRSNSTDSLSRLAYYWQSCAPTVAVLQCFANAQNKMKHHTYGAWKEYGPKWLCISQSHSRIRGPWCPFHVLFFMRLSLCFPGVVPPMTGWREDSQLPLAFAVSSFKMPRTCTHVVIVPASLPLCLLICFYTWGFDWDTIRLSHQSVIKRLVHVRIIGMSIYHFFFMFGCFRFLGVQIAIQMFGDLPSTGQRVLNICFFQNARTPGVPTFLSGEHVFFVTTLSLSYPILFLQ